MMNMALCQFANNYHIFDITPVENLYIEEFMLKAPGDFVKVYIYGLKQCYHSELGEDNLDTFSKALSLDTKTVQNAFSYWERQGILKINQSTDNSISVEYFNIKDILYNKNYNNMEKTLYRYKDFNQNLQLIFGNRLLTPQEYIKIYDWIEVLELPKEVVLMMIQFYIAKKGSKISINYLDKVAISWAEQGINTLQKSEEYIQTSESCYQDTIAVLKYLGIHRSPSKVELELYKKWRDEWAFSLSAILQACKETAKIQSPNFAYLDKILENFNRLGLSTPQDIYNYINSRDVVNNHIKEVMYELGYKDSLPSPEHQSMYLTWTQKMGIEHDTIILACKQCVRKKQASFDKLDILLQKWVGYGLRSPGDIKDYLTKKKQLDMEIQAVLDRAGEKRGVTSADRKIFKQWTEEWNMPYEVVLLAAEYSLMAENKLPFMHKILYNWHIGNIKTVASAKEDHEKHVSQSRSDTRDAGLKKQVDFNNFEQHSYTDEELESLFEDIENA
jgi:DnaD/phage-associated family protein